MKYTLVCLCFLLVGLMPVSSLADDASDQAAKDAADQIAKVEKKVVAHLNSYYLTKKALGIPSSAQPLKVTIDIDSTQPVEGWTRRYRTTGTATVITASEHSPNYACHFEVTSEIDEQGVVQITDTHSERVHD